MKSKMGVIVIIIVILIMISSVFAWCVSAGIGGNKVTVKGTVYYDMFTGWGVTCDSCLVEEDSFIGSPLWYMPWETKDINVVAEMSNGKTYSADGWTDKLNLIVGSTAFSVDLRHIPAGSYTGVIYLYEVEKGFLFGEKSRVLQASTSFEVEIT